MTETAVAALNTASNGRPLEHITKPISEPESARNARPALYTSPEQFWHELIDTPAAAALLNVTERSLRDWRSEGKGPPFIRISSRCIRYTRWHCRQWWNERLRISTADAGSGRVA